MKRVFTTVEHFEGGVHMHTSYKPAKTTPTHSHKDGHCAGHKHTLLKHIKHTPCMVCGCAPAGCEPIWYEGSSRVTFGLQTVKMFYSAATKPN